MSKSKLSATEWDLVKDAPFWVNAALSAADGRVALITRRVEAKALTKAIKNHSSKNALVRDIANNDDDPAKAIKKASQSDAEKALGQISDIVERKLGSDNLDTFNDFLLGVGRSIAEAAGEGVLGIGDNTSDEESEALQSIANALKATDKDKRARRQAKQAAAQAERASAAKAKAEAAAKAKERAEKAQAAADAKAAARAKIAAKAKAKAEAAAKVKERAEKAQAVADRQAKFKAQQRKRDIEAKARKLARAKEKAEQEAASKVVAAEEAKAASKSRFTVFIADHKVVSGENLSFISQKYYNTQANWRLIYE
ncbi:MAG: hypothetical protein GY805_14050, partial [Chloroflexi bacterium]|nr:hypothetical protein [Chloroflexota bacterium]